MFANPRRSAVLLTAALFLAAAAATGIIPRSTATSETTTVIVELKQEPAAVHVARARREGRTVSDEQLQAYRAQVRAGQDEFLAALASRGVQHSIAARDVRDATGAVAATVALRYTYVYNGLALKVPRDAVDAVRAMPQVKSVRPNGMLYTQLDHSVKYINAPKVYGAVPELTQFDDLREGYEGQGINLAVLDTGIDWTHPMFGGDPTPPRLGVAPSVAAVNTNEKVIYYLPLTDIAANDGFGHGTHVASTAAGYLARHPGGDGLPNTADDINLHGVAPQAKLMSYTVCSNIRSVPGSLGLPSVGGCEAADIVMALEDAVSPFTVTGLPKPVAHVINLSLGGSGGPDNVTAVACSNAALTGATVVASSGNSGPGEGTTGSPAAGTHVISVGATTHPGAAGSQWSADVLQASAFPAARTGAVTPAGGFGTQAGFTRLTLHPMSGSSSLPAASMAQRYVYVDDPAVPWPASASGRIALVKNFATSFFDLSLRAQNAGAVGIIVLDDRGAVNGVKTLIPAATISPAEGELLIDALSSTDNNQIDPPSGAVSELPIRMNPFFSETFVGEMGTFSSRGPVRGLGQIKPDVSAPGVAVLAAVPPASVLAAIGTLEGTPNYAHLDGTSMSSPHVAGVAALVKQAHPDWTPDVIRTALINTATNLRNQAGTPKTDGHETADSIIAQGGGLVDVPRAVRAKALMGVAGDGLDTPGILGSHSYGEVPVINSRVTHTAPVTVTVRDLSGQGGTYQLGVANNRDLQLAGIGVSLSQQSVTLQPGGEATFTVSATVDGDLLRDVMAAKTLGSQTVFEKIQMQWFVTAKGAGESLRMPFFFRPGPAMPTNPTVDTTVVTDIMPAGDGGAQRDTLGFQPELSGITYKDLSFEVDASTFRVEAATEWTQVGETGQPDLDYQLLGPDGEVVTQSGNGVGGEFVSVTVTRPGTYTHRVIGFSNAATEFTVTTTLTKGTPPPVLNSIAGEFTDSQNRQVDFDGAFTLSWQGAGGEQGYEVERSSNGGASWELIASTGGDATSLALADQPNGELSFRVRSLNPGRIGFYVTPGGAPRSIVVDRRTQADITSLVKTAISNVSFTGGTFQLDMNLTNQSADSYVPHIELRVVRISSASGTVRVSNADNRGEGTEQSPAAFSYSNLVGAEQVFSPAEASGARTLRFSDPAAELFTFDVQVTAFRRTGAASGATPAGGGGTGAGGSDARGDSGVLTLNRLLRFTANPLTRGVTVQAVSSLR